MTLLFLSFSEILVVFFVILILFGPKKLPEIARTLGKGLNEFNKAKEEIKKELTKETEIGNEIKNIKKDIVEPVEKDINEVKSGINN
jgi:TatA/E family protein of Tat protein translocase